jgi:hypothetical protein
LDGTLNALERDDEKVSELVGDRASEVSVVSAVVFKLRFDVKVKGKVRHCIGSWAGRRASLDECGKCRRTGIRSLDRPARSESI